MALVPRTFNMATDKTKNSTQSGSSILSGGSSQHFVELFEQAKPPQSAAVGPSKSSTAKVPAITSTSSSSIRRRRERRDDPSGILGDVSTPVFHRNTGTAPPAPPQEPLLLRQVSKAAVMLPRPATETRTELSAAHIRGQSIDSRQAFHEGASTRHKIPLKSALKRPVPPQAPAMESVVKRYAGPAPSPSPDRYDFSDHLHGVTAVDDQCDGNLGKPLLQSPQHESPAAISSVVARALDVLKRSERFVQSMTTVSSQSFHSLAPLRSPDVELAEQVTVQQLHTQQQASENNNGMEQEAVSAQHSPQVSSTSRSRAVERSEGLESGIELEQPTTSSPLRLHQPVQDKIDVPTMSNGLGDKLFTASDSSSSSDEKRLPSLWPLPISSPQDRRHSLATAAALAALDFNEPLQLVVEEQQSNAPIKAIDTGGDVGDADDWEFGNGGYTPPVAARDLSPPRAHSGSFTGFAVKPFESGKSHAGEPGVALLDLEAASMLRFGPAAYHTPSPTTRWASPKPTSLLEQVHDCDSSRPQERYSSSSSDKSSSDSDSLADAIEVQHPFQDISKYRICSLQQLLPPIESPATQLHIHYMFKP